MKKKTRQQLKEEALESIMSKRKSKKVLPMEEEDAMPLPKGMMKQMMKGMK